MTMTVGQLTKLLALWTFGVFVIFGLFLPASFRAIETWFLVDAMSDLSFASTTLKNEVFLYGEALQEGKRLKEDSRVWESYPDALYAVGSEL